MLSAALGLRLALELCLVSVAGWFPYRFMPNVIGLLGGALLVMIVLLAWGLLISPKRSYEIGRGPRLLLELGMFALAAAALASQEHYLLAAAFLLLEIADKFAVTQLQR